MGDWYSRLITDAMAKGVNLVLVTSMRQPQVVLALTARLKSGGYQVSAVERIAEDRFASPDRTQVKERGAKTR
jgi:Zeta toxin